MTESFQLWTSSREVHSLGTNAGSQRLPFQNWHSFKEAFTPELVRQAVEEDGVVAKKACLDPFGGSGTTPLACQFLGVNSTTVEVNPFLADVIRAKVAQYNADELASDLGYLVRAADRTGFDQSHLPSTFVEPGVKGRWLFSRDVAEKIHALLRAIQSLDNREHQRFYRVLLGGILVGLSNATVNGKGRRYRRDWQNRECSSGDVTARFLDRARQAIADVHRFRNRRNSDTIVIRADARQLDLPPSHDIAVFSPPYPNSFDYTDVYNIELWMLGYLDSPQSNTQLRQSTLTSHVQLHRQYAEPPNGSSELDKALNRLTAIRGQLWSSWIPEMVGAYFADLLEVLKRVSEALASQAPCWLVVGDSRYGGVQIPTATILTELVTEHDWQVVRTEPFRSMRSSAQQGGRQELAETLLVLRKTD